MVGIIRTDLGDTRESGRELRFEPTQSNTAVNVQKAIENAATAAGSRSVPVEAFGAVPGNVSGDQKIANVTSMNNAILAAGNQGIGVVDFAGGIYQIDGTVVNAPMPTNQIMLLRGTHRQMTRIEQYHPAGGIDSIHVGPPVGNPSGATAYGGGVQKMWLVSMVDQTSTAPSGGHLGGQLSITGVNQCIFDQIIIGEYNQRIVDHNHFAYKGIACDPASAAYSCTFHDIEIKGFGNIGFHAATETSGNMHYNIMVRNGGLGEPALKQSMGPLIQIDNGQGVWDQINLEWSIVAQYNAPLMMISSSSGMKFGHLHIEGAGVTNPGGGAAQGLLFLAGAGMTRFDSIGIISLPLSNTVAGLTSVAVFNGGFSSDNQYTIVGQLQIAQTSALAAGLSFYLVNDIAGPAKNWVLDFDGPIDLFGDGTFGSNLTDWSPYNFPNNPGPVSGLGVPPSNFRGKGILTVTSTTPGYSAGTYSPTMLDGIDTYIWSASAGNGTIALPQLRFDNVQPITVPVYPGTTRTIVNPTGSGVTLAVHNLDGTNILTAASLAAGQWVTVLFNGPTKKWLQVKGGTLF